MDSTSRLDSQEFRSHWQAFETAVGNSKKVDILNTMWHCTV